MPRKKPVEKLPVHVHIKKGDWYVGLNFPDRERTAGRITYQQIARRCEPETSERAVELAAEIKADYAASQAAAPHHSNQTVAAFSENFINAKKASLSRRTVEFYQAQHDRHVKDSEFGKLLLAQIKPLDVQRFYDAARAAGASSDAVRKLHQFLSAALNQAVRWETIPKNPVKGVILPKKKKPDTAALSPVEARRFIETCRKSSDYIIFEFALETGTRPQEYLAVTWDDIDLTNRAVHIRRAVAFGFTGGGYEFKETKTDGSNRTLLFSPQLAERLTAARAAQEKTIFDLKKQIKNFIAPKTKKPNLRQLRHIAAHRKAVEKIKNFNEFNLVFPSATGKPWSRLNLNRRDFKEVLKLAELDAKKFSLYSLRRTAATLLAAKINPKELAAFLGHTDVATTFRFYVLTDADSAAKTSNEISDLLY